MTMRSQFDIPTHPAYMSLTVNHIEQGRAAIANFRQMLKQNSQPFTVPANTRMANKHIEIYRNGKLPPTVGIAHAAEIRHQEQQYLEILKKRGLEHCA